VLAAKFDVTATSSSGGSADVCYTQKALAELLHPILLGSSCIGKKYDKSGLYSQPTKNKAKLKTDSEDVPPCKDVKHRASDGYGDGGDSARCWSWWIFFNFFFDFFDFTSSSTSPGSRFNPYPRNSSSTSSFFSSAGTSNGNWRGDGNSTNNGTWSGGGGAMRNSNWSGDGKGKERQRQSQRQRQR
jgi:hypothetical protein